MFLVIKGCPKNGSTICKTHKVTADDQILMQNAYLDLFQIGTSKIRRALHSYIEQLS